MATENKKALVYSILEFLQKSCEDGTINKDDTEGIEGAFITKQILFAICRETKIAASCFSRYTMYW